MSRQREPVWQTVLGVVAMVAVVVGAFCAWRWFEGYRASIWAEEMRKAGVAAPAASPEGR